MYMRSQIQISAFISWYFCLDVSYQLRRNHLMYQTTQFLSEQMYWKM